MLHASPADITHLSCQVVGAWFWWNKSDAYKRAIGKLASKDFSHFAAFCACLLLQCFDLGKCVRSEYSSGGGRAVWFFVKRPVDAAMHSVLALFHITVDGTPSLRSYTETVAKGLADSPARAPTVEWEVFADLSSFRALADKLFPGHNLGQRQAAELGQDPRPDHAAVVDDLPGEEEADEGFGA